MTLKSINPYNGSVLRESGKLRQRRLKASFSGRELSRHGIREFVNTKTIWIKRPVDLS